MFEDFRCDTGIVLVIDYHLLSLDVCSGCLRFIRDTGSNYNLLNLSYISFISLQGWNYDILNPYKHK